MLVWLHAKASGEAFLAGYMAQLRMFKKVQIIGLIPKIRATSHMDGAVLRAQGKQSISIQSAYF